MSKSSFSAAATPAAPFESCFAQGLDLSEFSSQQQQQQPTAASTTGGTCHAAKLMQETAQKAMDRRENEQQEMALAHAVHERSQSVVKGNTRKTLTLSSPHAALVEMHALDQKEPRQRLVAKKGPKTLLKKKMNNEKNSQAKQQQRPTLATHRRGSTTKKSGNWRRR